MHRENNRGQGVLRERKLEEAEWCGCSKQKKREEVAVRPREEKAQQGGMRIVVLNGTAGWHADSSPEWHSKKRG